MCSLSPSPKELHTHIKKYKKLMNCTSFHSCWKVIFFCNDQNQLYLSSTPFSLLSLSNSHETLKPG